MNFNDLPRLTTYFFQWPQKFPGRIRIHTTCPHGYRFIIHISQPILFINDDFCIAKISIWERHYLQDSMIIDQPVKAVLLRTFIGIFHAYL
jgi:hypothetical protein